MGRVLDFVKVLDFGLVKTRSGAGTRARATAPNAVTGTPAYLSPESALGEPVDRRSDIYALGCVAYWMLTGRYVFTGDSPIQIVARHVNHRGCALQAQASISPRTSMSSYSPASGRKPSDRPGTARDLCDRLGRCEVEPGPGRTRSWWETRMEPEALVSLVD